MRDHSMVERRQPVLPYVSSQQARGSVLNMRSSVSRTMCSLLRLVKRHYIPAGERSMPLALILCEARTMEPLDIGHKWWSDYPQSAVRLPIGVGCERPQGTAGRLRRRRTEQSSPYGRGFRPGSTAN